MANPRYNNQLELEAEAGPTVRPLQGLPQSHHGAAVNMRQFDNVKTALDVRTETNDGEMMTVSIGVRDNDDHRAFEDGDGNADLYATITWGMGGVSFEVDIDIMNGVTFSLPATCLKVDIHYEGTAPKKKRRATTYQIAAGVAYGTLVSRVSPTRRTVDVGVIQPGESFFLPVPKWAISFGVFTSPVEEEEDEDDEDEEVEDEGGAEGIRLALELPAGKRRARYVYTDDSNHASQLEDTYPIRNASQILVVRNEGKKPIAAGLLFNISF